MQAKMIFFPTRELLVTPKAWGLSYEDVLLDTADGVQLHGWYIPSPGAKQVVLFFHGNAGNISHRGESIQIFNRLGLNVLIIDYRGYGESQGKPSENGLKADAKAAWEFLVTNKEFREDHVIIFGRSLGGAVAVSLAADVQAKALILESTFSSASDMADSLLPLLSKLIVLRFRFDNINLVTQVNSPVLVIHSPEDEIIPFQSGQKLFDAANSPKQFVSIGGDHNSGFLLSKNKYEYELKAFIDSMGEAK